MLCSKCNLGIGHLEDDLDLVLAAVEYLRASGVSERTAGLHPAG